MVGRSLVAMAALVALATDVASADQYFTGDGTAYTLSQVSSGNCNFMSAASTASNNYAALNQAQWDSLGNCGRCAEVSCIDDSCSVQNKTEVVHILDRCPECKQGDLDLSPTVFKSITGSDPSRLTIQWKFVDCLSPSTIKVCLKEGSNANWVAVQPTNFAVGVKSVTVAGAATTMLDGAYYFINQSGGVKLSAVDVAITSINGDVVKGTYSLTAGSCTDTGKQFGSGGSSSSSTTTTTTAPATTTAAPAATTTAPAATTAAPAATTAAPAATTAAPPASGDDEYDDSKAGDYDDENDSTAGDYDDETDSTTGDYDDETDSSADSPVTDAPATGTTDAPASTKEAPASSTTDAPAAVITEAPSSSGFTPSKCRVRSYN